MFWVVARRLLGCSCSRDTVIQSYVQLKSGFYGVGWPMSMGQLWDAPAPQGCNFYPILRYGLIEPASLFKCGKFHISVKSTL